MRCASLYNNNNISLSLSFILCARAAAACRATHRSVRATKAQASSSSQSVSSTSTYCLLHRTLRDKLKKKLKIVPEQCLPQHESIYNLHESTLFDILRYKKVQNHSIFFYCCCVLKNHVFFVIYPIL